MFCLTKDSVSFFFYDFTDNSFKNFFVWYLTSSMIAFIAGAFGYAFGIMFESVSVS